MKLFVYVIAVVTCAIALAAAVIIAMPSVKAMTSTQAPEPAPQQFSPTPTTVTTFTPGPIHYAGAPIRTTYPNEVTILKRIGFEIAYDEKRQNPAWVAYKITLDKWDEEWKRPSRFSVDPETLAQISHGDYTNSGYDRGHMAPNEAISESYGRDAQLQTFMMSNVVPQDPDLNQGPWRIFEEFLIEQTKTTDDLWVITGPIYDTDIELLPNEQIEIPDMFFKVVIDEVDGRIVPLSVIMPQEAGRRDSWKQYRVTIDAAELASGWDFLSGLEDEIEAATESR